MAQPASERTWQRVWEIYAAAIELPASEWEAFVHASESATEIRTKVLTLLETGELEAPPEPSREAPLAGERIGRYVLLSALGHGGMGEVFSACDTELQRLVAIKFLKPRNSAGVPAVNDLKREARALSALNHPNIVTVHEIIESRLGLGIVMEFIEGDVLRSSTRTPLAADQLLKIGEQMAEALAAAHAVGIVHRDIKPENVMLRRDGYVKILDFGLARNVSGGRRSSAGLAIGTLRYMSPEQTRVETLTGASDVFSTGLVLYELATGIHPFDAPSALSVMHTIATQPPPSASVSNPNLPEGFSDLLSAMLARDPAVRPTAAQVGERLRAIRASHELSTAGSAQRSGTSAAATEPPVALRRPRWAVVSALAGASVLLIATVVAWQVAVPNTGMAPVSVVPLTAYLGNEVTPAFSPDGKQVAFAWNGPGEDNYDIYVSLIGTSTALRLTTDGAADGCPAWSPDGRWIAFMRGGPKPSLMLVPALGGPERALVDTGFDPQLVTCGIDWSPDGRYIAFPIAPSPGMRSQIVLLSPETGERRTVSFPPPETLGDVLPRFSPDGKSLAFLRQRSLEVFAISVVPLAGGEPRTIRTDAPRVYSIAWTRDSRDIVFAATYEGRTKLWRVPSRGSTRPEPVSGVDPYPFGPSSRWSGAPGAALLGLAISPQAGYLAYTHSVGDTNIWRLDLHGGRPVGAPAKLAASTQPDAAAQFAPDGKRIVFASQRSGAYEIWVCAADGSGAAQLTHLNAPMTGSPHWSPSGRKIAFDSIVDGQTEIYTMNADGGPPARITHNPGWDAVPTWSRDGRWIYFTSDRTGERQIWKVPAEGGSAVQITRRGGVNAFESADGTSVYYAKGITAGGIWKVPAGGGEETLVLDKPGPGRWGCIQVVDDGIYFTDAAGDGQKARDAVFFYDFATRRISQVALLAGEAPVGMPGLSLSPDHRALLYTQLDSANIDLMLVQNFR
jgi:Tol biopolymer transport system component